MSKKPLILGIESSCDETAASLITENEEGMPIVLSNIISSQIDIHKEFGGVVPELAARSHIEKIDWIVKKAIDESGRSIEEIDEKLGESREAYGRLEQKLLNDKDLKNAIVTKYKERIAILTTSKNIKERLGVKKSD